MRRGQTKSLVPPLGMGGVQELSTCGTEVMQKLNGQKVDGVGPKKGMQAGLASVAL